jgi:hypothetical protein
MNLQSLDQKAAKLPVMSVLSIISFMALIRLTDAVIDYRVYWMDRNAPTINTAPPHFPRPFQHGVQVHPAVPTSPYSVCDDECKQREQIFI